MSSESDKIDHRSPDTLSPHPENEEIYGDRNLDSEEDASFIDSIRENGILTPVIVDQNDQIISGHRRVEAAKQIGLETIPVTVREFESDLERLQLLIHSNRQRSKTVSQKLREAETLERIERQRAKERQGTRTDTSSSSEQDDEEGQTRDKVAEKVGFGSGTTYHRARTVWDARESDDETVAEVAEEQLDQLDAEEQSISGAYAKVKNAQQRAEETSTESESVSTDSTGSTESRITLVQADAESLPLPDESVDIIITSPPYNLGHERWTMGWRSTRKEGIGYYDDRPENEYQEWQQHLLSEWHRVACEGASLFYIHKVRIDGGEVIHPIDWLDSQANPWSVRQEIVWNRKSTHNQEPTLFRPQDARVYWLTKGTPAVPEDGIDLASVWDIYGPRPDTNHPAPFPDEIPERCLEAIGKDGDTVLDPMGGSMTSCRVAADLGYRTVGIDLNREYILNTRQNIG